jgi:type I restriction-modification system DNA methylase subunit
MGDYDVVGNFYGEFLKYTGGDKKGLGIVLTPKHITELFAELADIKKDSIVLDPCAGTGGFLISAMHKMLSYTNSKKEECNIKKNNLIGIEQQPNMFALASSNMILRGDGKANLYQASCFDENIKQEIKTKNCTAGMINPPYSQKDKSGSELDFVYNMLDMLTKGGIGIAIIPISCVIQKNTLKEKLLKHHTLVAVLSMPSDLFYPVGTVTCIVVFQAHIPHKDTNKETWFAYCKDDGHKLLKHQGRVNISWQEIKEKWVYNYKNKKEVAGFSVMKMVTANDEWCAERYMETDYSTLTENDFKNTLHEYTAFLFSNKLLLEPKQQSVQEAKINLDFKSWQSFSYEQIFDIKKCSAYDIEEFSQ